MVDQELNINSLELENDLEEALDICAKNTTSMTFAQKYQSEQEMADALRPVEEQVPREFHKYLKVFSKEAVSRFPEHKPWDHKIELKPGFEPKAQKAFQ